MAIGMRIIAAWYEGTMGQVQDRRVRSDIATLRKMHAEALKTHPTWEAYGGVLTIGTRKYQVVEGILTDDYVSKWHR